MIKLDTFTFDGEQVLTFRFKDFDFNAGAVIQGPSQIYIFHDQSYTVEEDDILSQEIAPSDIAGVTMIDNIAQTFIEKLYAEDHDILVVMAKNGVPRRIYYGKKITGQNNGNKLLARIDDKTVQVVNMPYIILKKKGG